MARLGNIQEYEKRKAAATPVGTTPQSQSVREGFQQMAQKTNVNNQKAQATAQAASGLANAAQQLGKVIPI